MKSLVRLAEIARALCRVLSLGLSAPGKQAGQRESMSEQVQRVKGKAELLARLAVNRVHSPCVSQWMGLDLRGVTSAMAPVIMMVQTWKGEESGSHQILSTIFPTCDHQRRIFFFKSTNWEEPQILRTSLAHIIM